jgi:hypothetical protein
MERREHGLESRATDPSIGGNDVREGSHCRSTLPLQRGPTRL